MSSTRSANTRTLVGAAAIVAAIGVALLAAAGLSSAVPPAFNPTSPTQGFLLVTEGNAELTADESEGPSAIGGDLTWGSYNVIRASAPTPIAPGDTVPMALLVNGRLDFATSSDRLQVNDGYFKLGDPTGALVTNNGGANPRVVAAGEGFDSTPAIMVNGPQSVDSVTADVPASTFDFAAAFAYFRAASAHLGVCESTITLLRRDDSVEIPGNDVTAPNTPVRIRLIADQQNVLTITAASLANISEITFDSPLPSSTTPLLINVVTSGLSPADQFTWVTPNTAGISGAQAPYMLWNFPTATSLIMPPGGGATIEGTVYAPNADVQFASGHNIEGNVIAKTMRHADNVAVVGQGPEVRELHYFPFDALLEGCSNTPPTSTTSTTTTSTTTTSTTTTSTTTTSTTVPDTSTTSTTSTTTTSTSSSTSTSTVPDASTTTTTDPDVEPPTGPTTTDSGVLPPGPTPAPPTVPSGGSLPATGSDGTGTMLGLAGLVTLCGVIALAVRRPRGRSLP